jgi:hypothetical protein
LLILLLEEKIEKMNLFFFLSISEFAFSGLALAIAKGFANPETSYERTSGEIACKITT